MPLSFDGAEQPDLHKYALVKRINTSIASFYQVYFSFLIFERSAPRDFVFL